LPDDLWIPYVRLPTEDNIRTDVYCDPVVRELARAGGQDGMTTDGCQKAAGVKTWRLWRSGKVEKRSDLYCDKCKYSIDIIDRGEAERARKDIQRTFYRQEAALLAPSDNSDRLNQWHSQNLLLRGAAFDGVIAALLSFLHGAASLDAIGSGGLFRLCFLRLDGSFSFFTTGNMA
jgi:hypothetical protein